MHEISVENMSKENSQHPLALLRDLERRSRSHAHGLPQQEELKQEWGGIAFSLGQTRLLAPLGEVIEILTIPGLSRIPGVKPWVLGIANVRGNLLPIMDLAGYLHGSNTVMHKRSRVLVMNYNGVFAGLLVDNVTGLRRFEQEDLTTEVPGTISGAYVPYLERAYRKDQEHWAVFSMHRLVKTPEFLQVTTQGRVAEYESRKI